MFREISGILHPKDLVLIILKILAIKIKNNIDLTMNENMTMLVHNEEQSLYLIYPYKI